MAVVPRAKGPLASLLARDSRDDQRVIIREILAATTPVAHLMGEIADGGGVLTAPGFRAEL
jgi:hypothetical protein